MGLRDGLLVFLRVEVLVVVAPQSHCLGILEEIHVAHELVRISLLKRRLNSNKAKFES